MGVPQLETVHPTAQLCNTKFNIYNTHYKQDNKVNQVTLVWACTKNGRKQKSQKSIVYEFGN